jgi:hypothetical protein
MTAALPRNCLINRKSNGNGSTTGLKYMPIRMSNGTRQEAFIDVVKIGQFNRYFLSVSGLSGIVFFDLLLSSFKREFPHANH